MSPDLALLLNSDTLPKPDSLWLQERLKRMGIVVGKDVDEFFVGVTLPPGWVKLLEAPPRAAWLHVCHLLDTKMRRRAEIRFHVAGRHCPRGRAGIHLLSRYRVDRVYFDDHGNRVADFTGDHSMLAVLDGESISHHAPVRAVRELTKTGEQDSKAVYGWIRQHFPRWEDPLAYWD